MVRYVTGLKGAVYVHGEVHSSDATKDRGGHTGSRFRTSTHSTKCARAKSAMPFAASTAHSGPYLPDPVSVVATKDFQLATAAAIFAGRAPGN